MALGNKENLEFLAAQHKHLHSALQCVDTNFMEFLGATSKDNFVATQLRNLGNAFYLSQKFEQAWLNYSKSVSCAHPDSLELAQAYSNRAKVLFARKYYKECLQDIERAQAIKAFPKESKNKLVDLKQKALNKLDNQKPRPYHDPVPVITNPNAKNPSAADCIEIKESSKWGRHVVASRDIEAGEVLLVEDPYSQSIMSAYCWEYCTECMELCYNMIPCDGCFTVMFCSQTCKDKAQSYHKYECLLVQSDLQHFKMQFLRMSIKCFAEVSNKKSRTFSKEYEQFRKIKTKNPQNPKEFTKTLPMITDVSNFLVLKTNFLKEMNIDDKREAQKLLEATMRHNILVCSERHALVRVVSYNKEDRRHKWMGRGVYNFYSNFNHSCLNNVGYSFYGKKVVLRSTRKIPKGEQCFVNYNKMLPLKWHTEYRQEFQKIIYHFTCKCRACVEKWPMTADILATTHVDDMASQIAAFKITEIMTERVKAPAGSYGELDAPTHQRLLKDCFELAEKIKTAKPSMEMDLLWVAYDDLLFRGNCDLKF